MGGDCCKPVLSQLSTKQALSHKQENNPSHYFLLKKIKPEDVTGGKAIEHEIIISLGH